MHIYNPSEIDFVYKVVYVYRVVLSQFYCNPSSAPSKLPRARVCHTFSDSCVGDYLREE